MLICQPFVEKWQTGQYVTYYLEIPSQEKWRATSIHAMDETSPGKWNVCIFVRVADRDFFFVRTEATEEGGDGNALLIPSQFGALRGSEPTQDEVMSVVADCANAFNVRFDLARNADKCTGASVDLACGIKNVFQFRDPWPEFGYEKVHSLSQDVFLTGLVQSEASDGRATMTMTSYGVNNPEVYREIMPYSFVDTLNPKRIKFDDFSLTIPSTWFFQQIESGHPDERLWLCNTGGNDHACTTLIKLYGGANRNALYQERKIQKANNVTEQEGKMFQRTFFPPDDFTEGILAIDAHQDEHIILQRWQNTLISSSGISICAVMAIPPILKCWPKV